MNTLKILELEMSKHSSLSSRFRKDMIHIVKKYPEEVKIVNNKYKLDVRFFEIFIKEFFTKKGKEDDKKDERQYYKNFNRLKRFNLIHQKSASSFPRSLSLISINPNHQSLLMENFDVVDQFSRYVETFSAIDKKDSFLDKKLYIYLRFLAINVIGKNILSQIDITDCIVISPTKVVLYVPVKDVLDSKYEDYQLFVLDEYASRVVNILKEQEYTKLFEEVELFEKDTILKIKRECNGSLHDIKKANNNYYLFKKSPVFVSVFSKTIPTVKLTISEINTLYPKSVPMHLLAKEKKVLEAINKTMKSETFITSNENISGFRIVEIECLMLFLRDRKNIVPKKEINDILKEMKEYEKSDTSKHVKIIFKYIEYLLNLVIDNKLKPSSVRSYIWILNKHLFKMIRDFQDIQSYEIESILKRFEVRSYKKNTIKTIKSKIRSFFRFCNKKEFELNIFTAFYPKSLVLAPEIDMILDTITNNNQVSKLGKHHKLRILQKKVIILVAFYTGMRKNELRTRLLEDFYMNESTLFFDINAKGLRKEKLRLKTKNSKRRIKSIIENDTHVSIIKEWLYLRKGLKNNSENLFLETSKNGGFLNKVISESVFDELGHYIKEVTNRYCSFHSLRHSYATYKFIDVINRGSSPYEILELSVLLGHETPATTFNSYVHADLMNLI